MHAPNAGSSATLVRSTSASRWWGSFRRTGGFRTTQLNFAGWTAVLGPGAFAGFVIGVLSGRRTAVTAIGVASSWTLALIVDWRVWRRSGFSVDVTNLDDADLYAAKVSFHLRGIEYRIEERWFEGDAQHLYLHSTVKHQDEILDTLHRYSIESD